MLRIRLTRVGKKKQPHYRVVVADIEAPRDGRIVERIGYYSPLTESDLVDINEERALYWLSVGAQPTDTVRSLLRKQGTLHRLSRLRTGETMEALIAEYKQETGQLEPQPAAAAPAVAEAEAEAEAVEAEAEAEEEPVMEATAAETEEESVVDEAAEAVDDVADTAADVVEEATATLAEAAGDTLEAVEEVIGTDEEE